MNSKNWVFGAFSACQEYLRSSHITREPRGGPPGLAASVASSHFLQTGKLRVRPPLVPLALPVRRRT